MQGNEELPDHVRAYVDPKGRTYYYNLVTKKTAWSINKVLQGDPAYEGTVNTGGSPSPSPSAETSPSQSTSAAADSASSSVAQVDDGGAAGAEEAASGDCEANRSAAASEPALDASAPAGDGESAADTAREAPVQHYIDIEPSASLDAPASETEDATRERSGSRRSTITDALAEANEARQQAVQSTAGIDVTKDSDMRVRAYTRVRRTVASAVPENAYAEDHRPHLQKSFELFRTDWIVLSKVSSSFSKDTLDDTDALKRQYEVYEPEPTTDDQIDDAAVQDMSVWIDGEGEQELERYRIMQSYDPEYDREGGNPEHLCHRTRVDPPSDVPASAIDILLTAREIKMPLEKVEPLFASLALYDIKEKQKVSETFYFDLNDADMLRRLPRCLGNIDEAMLSRNAIFAIPEKNPNLFLVLRIDKVAWGEDEPNFYLKAHGADAETQKKYVDKYRPKFLDWGEKYGSYLQPFLWGAVPVIDREKNDLCDEKNIVFRMLFRVKGSLGPDDIFQHLKDMEDKKKSQKHKPFPASASFDVRRLETLYPPARLDPSLRPVRDAERVLALREGETKDPIVREVLSFAQNHQRPSISYFNMLYVYPDTFEYAKKKNVVVRVELRDQDGMQTSASLPVVFGQSSMEARGTSAMTSLCPRTREARFADEIKIELPTHLHEKHHLFFTVVHVDLENKKGKQTETLLGHAKLPLLHNDRLIDDGLVQLPVCEKFDAHYLDDSIEQNYMESSKAQFKVRVRVESSIYPRDEALASFFREFRARHATAADEERLMKRSLDALADCKISEAIRLLPVLLTMLLETLCSASPVVRSSAFAALCRIAAGVLRKTGDETHRSLVLSQFVQYIMTNPNHDEKPLYLVILEEWERVSADEKSPVSERALNVSWFLLDIAVKAIALKLHDVGELKGSIERTSQRLGDEFWAQARSWVNAMSDLIGSPATPKNTAEELNRYMALFARDLLSFAPVHVVLSVITPHLDKLKTAKDTTTAEQWADFLSVLCNHDSFVALDGGFRDAPAMQSATELSLTSGAEDHPLSSMVLDMYYTLLKTENNAMRNHGVRVLRYLLCKHDFDTRLRGADGRAALASLYLGIVPRTIEVADLLLKKPKVENRPKTTIAAKIAEKRKKEEDKSLRPGEKRDALAFLLWEIDALVACGALTTLWRSLVPRSRIILLKLAQAALRCFEHPASARGVHLPGTVVNIRDLEEQSILSPEFLSWRFHGESSGGQDKLKMLANLYGTGVHKPTSRFGSLKTQSGHVKRESAGGVRAMARRTIGSQRNSDAGGIWHRYRQSMGSLADDSPAKAFSQKMSSGAMLPPRAVGGAGVGLGGAGEVARKTSLGSVRSSVPSMSALHTQANAHDDADAYADQMEVEYVELWEDVLCALVSGTVMRIVHVSLLSSSGDAADGAADGAAEREADDVPVLDPAAEEAPKDDEEAGVAIDTLQTLLALPGNHDVHRACHDITRLAVHRFSTVLYGRARFLALSISILRHCMRFASRVRRSGAALWYKIVTSGPGARVRAVMTVALSELIGSGEMGETKARQLQVSLAEAGKVAAARAEISAVGEFASRLLKITDDTKELIRGGAPATKAALMLRIADGYRNAPVLAKTWISTLVEHQSQVGHFAEAATAALRVALLSVHVRLLYGTAPEKEALGELARPGTDVCKSVQHLDRAYDPAVYAELAAGEDGTVREEVGPGGHFDLQALRNALQLAAKLYQKGGLQESAAAVLMIQMRVLQIAPRAYKELGSCCEHMAELWRTAGDAEAMANTRPFATYFRIVFLLGDGCEDPLRLSQSQFVLRAPAFTHLSEITERYVKDFAPHFPGAVIRFATDSKSVPPAGEVYISVTAVHPETPPVDQRAPSKRAEYDMHAGVQRFYFETPFTPGGKSHGGLAEQWLRRTTLETEHALPYVLELVHITKHSATELTPLQVAIREIKSRCAALRAVTSTTKTDKNRLQGLLQGSVSPQVNSGAGAIYQTFLGDEAAADEFDPAHVEDLRESFKQFMKLCRHSLDMNKKIISDDQVEFHKQLEGSFAQMKSLMKNINFGDVESTPRERKIQFA